MSGPTRTSSDALAALVEAAATGKREADVPPPIPEAEPTHAMPTVKPGALATLSQVDASTGRTVAELRPRPPLVVECHTTVLDAARQMHALNVDVVLVQSAEGALVGIVTDTDVAHKLLAEGDEPAEVLIEHVMTADPHCISASAPAVAALWTMIERRFRHLPVVNARLQVQGVLDISKCLHDAVSRLDSITLGASVTLGSLLPAVAPTGSAHDKSSPLDAAASVRQAARAMRKRRTGVLVEADGCSHAGVLTPKDLLFRVVAQGLPADSTPLSAVMTPRPDTMLPTDSVRDALSQAASSFTSTTVTFHHCLHLHHLLLVNHHHHLHLLLLHFLHLRHNLQGSGYRTMPVVSASGESHGVLDILGLMQGTLHKSDRGMLQVRARRMHQTDFVKEEAEAAPLVSAAQSLIESAADEPDAAGAPPDYSLQALLEARAAEEAEAAPPEWWGGAREALLDSVADELAALKQSLISRFEVGEAALAKRRAASRFLTPAAFLAAGILIGAALARR
ncbi:hypothetical protein AB1Y20_017020 [Prymnesium parvum]|uniref:CBS domain-containing protein n=1 Tax=Prymnesium parvum TaxID=97485 RepID=A0AB34IC73_PRYPA